MRKLLASPRTAVLSRALAAIFGGYALAAGGTAFLSLALPIVRSEAVLTATLTGIVVYTCAVLWAFATRSAFRAWLGVLLPAALMAAGAAWLGGPA